MMADDHSSLTRGAGIRTIPRSRQCLQASRPQSLLCYVLMAIVNTGRPLWHSQEGHQDDAGPGRPRAAAGWLPGGSDGGSLTPPTPLTPPTSPGSCGLSANCRDKALPSPRQSARRVPQGRGPPVGRRLAWLAATAPALPVWEVVALAGKARRSHPWASAMRPPPGARGLSWSFQPCWLVRTWRTSDHVVMVLRIAARGEVLFAVPNWHPPAHVNKTAVVVTWG